MVMEKGVFVKDVHSNNEAEYVALSLGLEWCLSNGITRLNVYGDSMLIVKQIQETWACKSDKLAAKLRTIKGTLRKCKAVQVHYIARGKNQLADTLASNVFKEAMIDAMKLQEPKLQEALPTSRVTAKDVANFIFNNICCKFGTPLEIISDRGPGSRGDLVGEIMTKLGIKRRHFTPYYPQCNGLVEKVNGMICKIITKHVEDKAQKWNQHLDATLWAYRTSFKASLGYTPFQLVYGQEALLPIEVELSSLRVLQAREGGPKEKVKQRILALEKLELDREEAILHYVNQAEKRRINFNKKLKAKDIKENSLVLRYDNKLDNKKDGKFVPHWEGPFKVVRKYDNGSYQLMNTTGKLHKTRVNGWRLNPYFSQNFFDNEQWEQEA
ncbi:hypothetical protein L7F22_007965 [Adiantum nelumboides]|nr:hypothetical protein [Adiantum nelumboides]